MLDSAAAQSRPDCNLGRQLPQVCNLFVEIFAIQCSRVVQKDSTTTKALQQPVSRTKLHKFFWSVRNSCDKYCMVVAQEFTQNAVGERCLSTLMCSI